MERGKTKRLTLCGVMISVAMVLSYMERFIPLQLWIPLPGIRLGLANIVSMMALYFWGSKAAFTILIARCFLGAVFSGNITGLLFSVTGGIFAMICMSAARKSKSLSVYGVSILGAAAHNIGQVMAAVALMQSVYVVGYLPYLLLVSLFTGMFIGAVCARVFSVFLKNGQVPEVENREF